MSPTKMTIQSVTWQLPSYVTDKNTFTVSYLTAPVFYVADKDAPTVSYQTALSDKVAFTFSYLTAPVLMPPTKIPLQLVTW